MTSPRPGHDVQHAIRKTRLGSQLGDAERAQRCLLGRLDDHGVSAGERRPKLPRQCHRREVPRQHRGDDPDRLTSDKREVVRSGRRNRSKLLVDGFRIPTDRVDRVRHVDLLTIRDRLPSVDRIEEGDLLSMFVDETGQPEKNLPTAGRRQPPPGRPFKRKLSRPNGSIHVLGPARGHRREDLAGRREEGLKRLAGARVDEFTVDIGLRWHVWHGNRHLSLLLFGDIRYGARNSRTGSSRCNPAGAPTALWTRFRVRGPTRSRSGTNVGRRGPARRTSRAHPGRPAAQLPRHPNSGAAGRDRPAGGGGEKGAESAQVGQLHGGVDLATRHGGLACSISEQGCGVKSGVAGLSSLRATGTMCYISYRSPGNWKV